MPAGTEKVFEAEVLFIESDGTEIDLQLKTAIEGAVIQWASLCGDILQQSSIVAFAGGANPTPLAEVEFWNARLKNLECIFDQLRDPRVKKMALYLQLTESTYLTCFKNTFQSVVAGVLEAKDICLYLKPMKIHFERFQDNEFLDNEIYIRPLAHCLGLLWGNSRYYCTNPKIITLLREVANMLILATVNQLDPSSIFQGEAEDMYQKVEKCIEQLELFRKAFDEVRANILSYFKSDNMEPKPWTFHPRSVFQRLIDFLERLRLLNSILGSALEFQKLEKVEIGGIKGRLLSQKIEEILDEFNQAYLHFANIQYDLLEPEEKAIIKDNEIYMKKCDDLDQRLAAIFEQVFDDCHNMESVFKFINIAGTLIERPAIDAVLSLKYGKIITLFNQELDTVKKIYDEGQKNGIPIDKNYPPVAGVLGWLYKLKNRILKNGEDFRVLENPIVRCTDAVHAFEKWEEMLQILNDDQEKLLSEWLSYVPHQITKSLAKTQLLRVDDLLHLNLDPELIAILREVKYMRILEIPNIAPEAQALFDRNEELYKSLLLLYRIIEWYNHLKLHTLPVEYALIETEVNELDLNLEDLTTKLNWETDSKSVYV